MPLCPTRSSFVLLSGCTSGLGLDMARLFAARGWSLVLLGRDPAKLQELQTQLQAAHPAQSFETLNQDLAVPEAAELVLQKLKEMEFDVDGEEEEEAETASATGSSTSQAMSKKKKKTKFVDILVRVRCAHIHASPPKVRNSPWCTLADSLCSCCVCCLCICACSWLCR